MVEVEWQYSDLSKLTPFDVYDVLRLRQLVFVVEQKCLFMDADGYDLMAKHLMGRSVGELLVYARVLPPGVKYDEYSIGRVVVHPHARGKGLARAAMTEVINRIEDLAGPMPIRVQAQCYLADTLYAPLGFERIGGAYDEDGIAHVDMLRNSCRTCENSEARGRRAR
jgi:ElaA protein